MTALIPYYNSSEQCQNQLTWREQSILVTSATNNFLLNRDPEEYLPVLEDIFVSYTTTDEFACLSPEERMNLVNCYNELKIFLKALVRLRKPQEVIVP